MIASLFGKLTQKTPTQINIEVVGVGYEVEISMHTYTALPAVGEMVALRTHLQVREDAHTLYGFIHEAERIAYRQLIRINGIGARTALAILSTFTVSQLAQAIVARDVKLLTRVPGIGGKTAERLLVELKDRFQIPAESMGAGSALFAPTPTAKQVIDEVRQALLSLGYKESEVTALLRNMPEEMSVEDGIRQALKQLAKPNY